MARRQRYPLRMTANFAHPALVAPSPSASATAVAAESVARRPARQSLTPAERQQNELIEEHLPLVRRVLERIRRTLPRHIDVDDLHSVGVTGLIAAAQRFDPAQHQTFPGYASLRIRGAILDELRRLDWCPRRTRARTRRIEAAIQEAEQALGRAPTDAEMSDRMGMSSSEYAKWREASKPVHFLPLDHAVDGEESGRGSLHDVIADEKHVCVRERMEKEELLRLVSERIQLLPDVQKRILAMYYFEGLRLAEIAAVFGRTESRISQIHAQAVTNLRAQITVARNR
jgi:RNA polymerase sigma factor FliA